MPTYTVHFTNSVSTAVTVEADSPDEAIEAAYDDPKMPGSIAHGAFGGASIDDSDWEPRIVTDADGNEVWTDTLPDDPKPWTGPGAPALNATPEQTADLRAQMTESQQ